MWRNTVDGLCWLTMFSVCFMHLVAAKHCKNREKIQPYTLQKAFKPSGDDFARQWWNGEIFNTLYIFLDGIFTLLAG